MSDEAEPRRRRRFAVASMVASPAVLGGLFAAVQVLIVRTAPQTPEECRRFRLDELSSVFRVKLDTPTVLEPTDVGRLCHVEAVGGSHR